MLELKYQAGDAFGKEKILKNNLRNICRSEKQIPYHYIPLSGFFEKPHRYSNQNDIENTVEIISERLKNQKEPIESKYGNLHKKYTQEEENKKQESFVEMFKNLMNDDLNKKFAFKKKESKRETMIRKKVSALNIKVSDDYYLTTVPSNNFKPISPVRNRVKPKQRTVKNSATPQAQTEQLNTNIFKLNTCLIPQESNRSDFIVGQDLNKNIKAHILKQNTEPDFSNNNVNLTINTPPKDKDCLKYYNPKPHNMDLRLNQQIKNYNKQDSNDKTYGTSINKTFNTLTTLGSNDIMINTLNTTKHLVLNKNIGDDIEGPVQPIKQEKVNTKFNNLNIPQNFLRKNLKQDSTHPNTSRTINEININEPDPIKVKLNNINSDTKKIKKEMNILKLKELDNFSKNKPKGSLVRCYSKKAIKNTSSIIKAKLASSEYYNTARSFKISRHNSPVTLRNNYVRPNSEMENENYNPNSDDSNRTLLNKAKENFSKKVYFKNKQHIILWKNRVALNKRILQTSCNRDFIITKEEEMGIFNGFMRKRRIDVTDEKMNIIQGEVHRVRFKDQNNMLNVEKLTGKIGDVDDVVKSKADQIKEITTLYDPLKESDIYNGNYVKFKNLERVIKLKKIIEDHDKFKTKYNNESYRDIINIYGSLDNLRNAILNHQSEMLLFMKKNRGKHFLHKYDDPDIN